MDAHEVKKLKEHVKDEIQIAIGEGNHERGIGFLRFYVELEALPIRSEEPLLGLATTKELLDELTARIEIHGPGLSYRTVDRVGG